MRTRKAFTMIELVFVIVVIGVLSSIAIPKFAATRDSAIYTKMTATLAAVRNSLATERQKRIMQGVFAPINDLYENPIPGRMFTTFNDTNPPSIPRAQRQVLMYPIQGGAGEGQWSRLGTTYTANFKNGNGCAFTLANNQLTLTGISGTMTLGRCQEIFEN